jgi:hypothetical protein
MRSEVGFLARDRALDRDVQCMVAMVADGRLLAAARGVIVAGTR